MPPTWDEIILQSLSVKERGPRYVISLADLRAAVPQEFSELDPVDALNAALAGNRLIAVVDARVGFVTVFRRKG